MVLLVDPLTGLSHMLSHPFMRDALLAGTAIALVSGLIGYFVVLRSQVFAADALSHVAFAGALGALALASTCEPASTAPASSSPSCSRSSAAVLPPTTR
jgi:ABC-type Mn2+/Zn2+ transport system permease subunit